MALAGGRTRSSLGRITFALDWLVDFSRTKISLSRPLSDYSKMRALISWGRRNNPMFVPRVERGLYLNVGCGPNIAKGFVNIDYNWRPGVDLVWDITRPLPFPTGEVGGIYSEHCLEHLTLDGGKAFLAECARLLMPGASLRLIVPDLEMYARAYVEGLDGRSPVLPNEHYVNSTGVNRPVALINELFFGPDHRFIYDFATLRELLSQLGFSEITRCSINQGADPRLQIDDIGHVSESLYLEARR